MPCISEKFKHESWHETIGHLRTCARTMDGVFLPLGAYTPLCLTVFLTQVYFRDKVTRGFTQTEWTLPLYPLNGSLVFTFMALSFLWLSWLVASWSFLEGGAFTPWLHKRLPLISSSDDKPAQMVIREAWQYTKRFFFSRLFYKTQLWVCQAFQRAISDCERHYL